MKRGEDPRKCGARAPPAAERRLRQQAWGKLGRLSEMVSSWKDLNRGLRQSAFHVKGSLSLPYGGWIVEASGGGPDRMLLEGSNDRGEGAVPVGRKKWPDPRYSSEVELTV